ncbi:S41 family peptidase [Paenibacillus profundus]|uniref:S41 family peptidase n=1 Tax=Paenibacillus profundus TaxID=1173085 RepID=A0ABS8YMH9_9BACL|nr:S41 family peptidase [Paenibacillus profundus]MCE5173030.1 S41 family peptidase [Paenibacillus profundus]
MSSDTLYRDMILTKEQMLEDYDAMWESFEENYPFYGVLDRLYVLNNMEPDYYKATKTKYRKQIENMELEGDKAMFEFANIIAISVNDVYGTVGHVSIVNPNMLRSLEVYKEHVNESPEVQPWVDVIEDPQVIAFYEYLDYLLGLQQADKGGSAPTPEEINAQQEEELNKMKATNLTMKILEKGKIAYINVESFDDVFIEGDMPKIRAFLEEVKDYEHLIIDIQNNGGGNTTYWEEAFVRPNISEPATTSLVRLMKNTELTQRFYGVDYKGSALTTKDVKNDPNFTSLHKEDLEDLTLVREISYTLEPKFSEKLFKGEISVLVGPAVYSSAESFAVFCKSTHFATLVGKTTGGSNSGGPILFELPISHLLIQFDVEYGLNPDGSSSQEVGTTPDIESEDALKTVLDLIGKH